MALVVHLRRLCWNASMKHTQSRVRIGLDILVAEECRRLKNKRIGLLCHAASISSDLEHIVQVFKRFGITPVRCFGPEHGIWADAQDMISVETDAREPLTGSPVVSLYGTDEASLAPRAEDLQGLDLLVVDLQDVGSRYYTYIYTAALVLREAAVQNVPVMVLDRPNPLGGRALEGGMTGVDFTSFVGLWPLPTRHGLTIGEVCKLLNHREGFGGSLSVVAMEGWNRDQYFDETGIPWVQPSPNMPTLDTAIVYPGMCLFEGTNVSEGRGTTRPFELFGAEYINPFELANELTNLDLPGIAFRPVYFQPTFHKFGGQTIGGIALHVIDRNVFQPLRMGLHILGAIRRLFGDQLRWRTEVYEFVQDRLAIDLLFGGTRARTLIDSGASPDALDALWSDWQQEAETFRKERIPFLLYGDD